MQEASKKPSKEDEATGFIDCFGGELENLKRYIYTPSILRLRIYEFVLKECQNLFRTNSCMTFLLCSMFIAIQALDNAKRLQKMSEEGRWKEEVQRINELINEEIKNISIDQEKMRFFELLKERSSMSQLWSKYLYFLEKESSFIYQKFPIIWRLLEFHSFSTQNFPDGTLSQAEVDIKIQQFNLELIKKENQIQFQKHIEQAMLESNPMNKNNDLKWMMKQQTYLPQEDILKKTSRQASFVPGFTVKSMMVMEINLDTIDLVDRCETYECPYLLFHIPFLYLLTQTFSFYQNTHKELYIYRLFTTLFSKVNKIKNSTNPQLPKEEINDCIIDFINYRKIPRQRHAIKMGQFLKRNEVKMSTFIPVYFEIFSFHAFAKHQFVAEVFSKEGSIKEKRRKMKERVQEIFDSCQKYNNENI